MRPPWTQTFSHITDSSVWSEAFGSCPVFAETIQLGMPIPGPEQEEQAVDGCPPPDLAVPDRDLTPRAVPKQRLSSSSKSPDVEEQVLGGASTPWITANERVKQFPFSPCWIRRRFICFGSGTKAKQVQAWLLRLFYALGHHDFAVCTSCTANTDSPNVVTTSMS